MLLISSVRNETLDTITLRVPGFDAHNPLVLPAAVIVDLLNVLTLDQLETMQDELAGLVSRGTLSSQATTDSGNIGLDDTALKSTTDSFAGTGSHQSISADLTLDAAAGSSVSANPKYLAASMWNLFGDALTKAANYLAGVIGAYSITGTKATSYPAGAVLAQITDGVTEADGAVVAYVDGDSAVTKANAAFKAMANNSNAGSGFDYGVDLHSPAHDGYNALAILKADVRMSNEVCVLNGAGAPVDGTTGADVAGPGSLYIDITGANAYINTGPKTATVWKLVTRAA